MTIGLFAGMWTSAFLIIWSALGNWVQEQTPMWFVWSAAPVLLVAGLVFAGLGRVARFFPNLWLSFASLVGIACLASAIICFATDQTRYGIAFVVWMLVLALTFALATLANREA